MYSKTKNFPYLHAHMYSPFLWRIAKGQSWLIIKRWRWWSRISSTCQICSQSMKLIKHIPQKLSMHRLNSHDSIQHTSNRRIARWRWWRIHSSSRVNILLSSRITRWRPRCGTCRRLDSRAFRASFQLSRSLPKKGGTYRSYDMYGLRCRKIL